MNVITFSPTGNTRKITELIGAEWETDAAHVDLTARQFENELTHFVKGELTLIGVPSFGGRVPQIAMQHLNRLDGTGTPAVLVIVYGNRDYDDTLLELKSSMEQQGFQIKAAVTAVAEHSVLHQFAAGRPDAADQKQLQEFARAIREALTEHPSSALTQVPGNHPYRSAGSIPLHPKTGKGCTQCGSCAVSCPTGAIPAGAPNQTDITACISCMRCITICPENVRYLDGLILKAAALKLKKACAGRKENQLFLGESR